MLQSYYCCTIINNHSLDIFNAIKVQFMKTSPCEGILMNPGMMTFHNVIRALLWRFDRQRIWRP